MSHQNSVYHLVIIPDWIPEYSVCRAIYCYRRASAKQGGIELLINNVVCK